MGRQLSRRPTVGANLMRVNLVGATLNASLRGANLTVADLKSADLRSAVLSGAKLTDADLTAANLQDAVFNGVRLEGADLTGAIMVYTDTQGILTTTDLAGAHYGETTRFPDGFPPTMATKTPKLHLRQRKKNPMLQRLRRIHKICDQWTNNLPRVTPPAAKRHWQWRSLAS